MGDPSRVRVSGPLEFYADGFGRRLSDLGYTSIGAVGQLRLMAHVSRWLAGQRLTVVDLDVVRVEEFLAARRAEGYVQWCSSKAMVVLLEYLYELGVVPVAVLEPSTGVEALLLGYRDYLLVERGLVATTAWGYVDMVLPFVEARAATCGGVSDFAGLSAADVSRFVVSACAGRNRGSAKLLVTALRSLLRFLHVTGVIAYSLVAAVPSVASWRLVGLPRGLEVGGVRRLLDSCDRRTRLGRRDFAILTLLARLGLRRGEVASLSLDDIDWMAGEIVVRGKGSWRDRLPLPVDVGQAIVDYLQRGRPPDARGRMVFVRVRAPHRPLTPGGVTAVAIAAGQRCGLGKVSAHRLRHSIAVDLLRSGAGLTEIGQLLRHWLALTTSIYAKVDYDSLRSLARPWPSGDVS
jgi:integrase/recombinase XerD